MDRLEEWKKTKGRDSASHVEGGAHWRRDTLSIGDMIEFLGGDKDFKNLKRANELWIKSDNYCDALWEATKEKLER